MEKIVQEVNIYLNLCVTYHNIKEKIFLNQNSMSNNSKTVWLRDNVLWQKMFRKSIFSLIYAKITRISKKKFFDIKFRYRLSRKPFEISKSGYDIRDQR